jgi:transposase
MIRVFLLSERQMARISPYFPLSHGVPRVDHRRVVSGIVYVSATACNGRMRRAAMARTRRFTTASSAGAGSACLTGFSRHWPAKGQSQSAL